MSNSVETINPATGDTIAAYDRTSGEQVESRLRFAHRQASTWRDSSLDDRAQLLERLAVALETDRDEATANITREMGKPVSQAAGEVQKCIDLCRYYAAHIADLVAPANVDTNAHASYVRFDPLGAILGIMPWNFPYWQVFRWGVPTMSIGNTLVLKHADNVLGTAHHIGKLFEAADAPTGLFGLLNLANDDVRPVIEDARIRGVSLTGSVRAGKAVAAIAGGAIKPTVLELGGSDPCLILPDADLDRDMSAIVHARFQNTGQTCIAAKRYLVHKEIADDFVSRLREAVANLNVGDPTLETTEIGPIARRDLVETLADQVERCRSEGLDVLAGGSRSQGPGYFYEPTILTGVEPKHLPFREELFGPVASVCACDSIDQMVEWANATEYGLSANVWTRDLELGEKLTQQIDAGVVFVNDGVKSDMRLPFGGIKNSGYGRELGGHGVHQFANAKTVWIGSRR